MFSLKLEKLSRVVEEKVRPFLEEILAGYSENVDSIHLIGSAVTEDYHEKTSDISSIAVLKKMDLKFVEFLAPMGKKHSKKGISAPLIMTPEYIRTSLDVFPIEFLDFKHIHETVYGEDILRGLNVSNTDLRQQCEREVKSRLIGLRQGYISSMGDRQVLTGRLAGSISGYMPLFRGIICLLGRERPVKKHDVISELASATGVDTTIFRKVLDIKRGSLKPLKEEIDTIFEEYYDATERIGEIIDDLVV
jgi:predicted nucleotidyltransferase